MVTDFYSLRKMVASAKEEPDETPKGAAHGTTDNNGANVIERYILSATAGRLSIKTTPSLRVPDRDSEPDWAAVGES